MENWHTTLERIPLRESVELARTVCKGVTIQDICRWKKPEYYGSEPIRAIKNALHAPRIRRRRIGHRLESTLSDEEISRLQIILEHSGETKSELVKRLINEEYVQMLDDEECRQRFNEYLIAKNKIDKENKE